MFHNIGHVLYHVLIILFPILFYHLFLHKGSERDNKGSIRFLLVLLIMLIFTMSFPVEFAKGYNYDLRVIPIIIAFFYGGQIPGFIIIVTMLVYRSFFGGNGFTVTLINYTFASIILSYTLFKFSNVTIRMKILLISTIFWIIAGTRGITLLQMNQDDQIPFMLLFSVITWLTLVTVVFIIENLLHQLKLQNELHRSVKLKVISELAASVAHEVRNPMTTTRGFLQLMDQDENLNDSQKKYIHISLTELDRAQVIINDYLSLAKPNRETQDIIDLSVELHNIVELMLTYTNMQCIKIKSSIQDSLFIKGSRDEVKQVFINLMKNGMEALESGGTLTVNAFKKNQKVVVEVIDNGIGMNEEQLNHIGTPFYSTKERGTGVGLTISYQIIHQMRGEIEVKSTIGQGTAFAIRFPNN